MLPREGLNIIYEVAAIARASTALSEKGPSAVDRPLMKGTINFAAFDDRVHGSSHFGGDTTEVVREIWTAEISGISA